MCGSITDIGAVPASVVVIIVVASAAACSLGLIFIHVVCLSAYTHIHDTSLLYR